MKVIKHLLLSDDINKRQLHRILKTLPKEKSLKGYQFLIMRQVSNNLVEMISDKELYYRNDREDILLFGVVKNKEEGFNLIAELIGDVVKESHTVTKGSILKYLLNRERETVTFEIK